MELLDGAVDLYCHADPDLFPRAGDDIALATRALHAGFRAAVHRSHWCTTAERAQIAARVTGFDLLGAILLNDSVGGINPVAADLALRMGAVWVSFPTLSAKYFRQSTGGYTNTFKGGVEFGPAEITVLDADGELVPEAVEVLTLTREHEATLNLGYLSHPERSALLRAANDLGVESCVLTNPFMYDARPNAVRTLASIDEVVAARGTFVEFCCYAMHPSYHGRADPELLGRTVELIRRIGVDRAILSSDGGTRGTPSPAELLTFGCRALAECGFSERELRTLVCDNPARALRL